jgi:hypothetical protein
MKEKNIHKWKKKLGWIAECGGMALLNTHPGYMNLGEGTRQRTEDGGRRTEDRKQRKEKIG